MSALRHIFYAFLILGLLEGCGFRPMYGGQDTAANLQGAFASVSIAEIPNRVGQVVRNHLLDQINPHGGPAVPDFILSVNLIEEREGYGFGTDESINRESLTLEGDFRLIDQSTGKVVYEDIVRSTQAYDVVQSDFANFSAQQDAQMRTAEQVAFLITVRLGMFFKSLQTAE